MITPGEQMIPKPIPGEFWAIRGYRGLCEDMKGDGVLIFTGEFAAKTTIERKTGRAWKNLKEDGLECVPVEIYERTQLGGVKWLRRQNSN